MKTIKLNDVKWELTINFPKGMPREAEDTLLNLFTNKEEVILTLLKKEGE